ncbi:iron uptake transporter permease EfeU [Brevibacterium gallinarum]|uniref:FTR1 family protein n=1 Tax=Brevibacterium gallinarum TaxID=2762220 RepID=A0ABR8WQY0_9MICO|nr:iron uptake transporter permease EfeU [Brevibacterium gallinarum]MBD8019487.1 FTR1 family protein [Brevibacterium gallinarum]
MLQNFLIGLREGLEAALIVGILIGYLRRIGHTRAIGLMWIGIGIAITVSVVFGAILTFGPSTLTFEAQEALGGSLSIIAVGFVTWMVFWMAATARNLKGSLESDLERALEGSAWGLILVGALSVGREGLETTLFLWAATRSATSGVAAAWSAVGAALVGIAVAVVLAWLITRGLIRINLGKFFTITGGFLIIIAAGVLAYGIHDLQEAGILPGLHALAFDVSHAIPPTSWYGTLLKGVFNFSPATTWLELIAWWTYVGIVMPIFIARVRHRPRTPAPAAVPATA